MASTTSDELMPDWDRGLMFSSLTTLSELNGTDLFESITRHRCSAKGWILVDALLLLFVAFEVLADPGPEFAAGARCPSAEEHAISGRAIPLDLDLAERAALRFRFRACHGTLQQCRKVSAFADGCFTSEW